MRALSPSCAGGKRRFVAGVALAASVAGPAEALQFDTGNPDLSVRWDNTSRYSNATRVREQGAAVLANINTDDGDRNFGRGLISNRIELLSEFDVLSKSGYGLRVSGLGWYDAVYNKSNDNPGLGGGGFPNQSSVAFNAFTGPTRRTEGRKAELRDAFGFVKFDAAGTPVTLRLGQFAQVWGESLFFAANGIAGTQNAFDVGRLLADPTAQAKEFVLPVPQLSGQAQLTPALSLSAYVQFRWKATRLPSSGSYFSVADTVGEGAENLLVIPGVLSAPREADKRPPNSGQFGAQLRWRVAETDLGFYALRYHDKSVQQVARLGVVNVFGTPTVVPTSYYLAYNEASSTIGFSATRTFGDANIAAEVSVRRNQALGSSGGAADASALAPPGVIPPTDNRDHPGYAVGKTAHINLSTLWVMPSTPLWREAALLGEIVWNRVLSCEKHCSALDTFGTRDASAVRLVFSPTYRQALSGVDLTVPIGLGYSPKGSRSLALGPGALPSENGGDLTVGLNAIYETTWNINLAFTHYFGKSGTFVGNTTPPVFTYRNLLGDRDFVAFTLRRTF